MPAIRVLSPVCRTPLLVLALPLPLCRRRVVALVVEPGVYLGVQLGPSGVIDRLAAELKPKLDAPR